MQKPALLPALGEGFKLIARAPLAVLVWGVFTLILGILPYLPMAGGLTAVIKDSAQDPTAAIAALSGATALVQLLQIVCGVLVAGLLTSAIYRAVLRPEDRGFFYFKLSRDELHVGVTFVVLYILMTICIVVVAILVAIPVVMGSLTLAPGSGPSGDPSAIAWMMLWLFGILIVAGLALAIPGVRLGMALPMTFAEGKIRIFEAWAFTKGYTWNLFGMLVVQVLMVSAIYFVVGLITLAVIGAMAFTQMQDFADDPSAIMAMLPAFGVGLGVMLLLNFIMTPILYAPWAKAYQLIADAREGGKADVFS